MADGNSCHAGNAELLSDLIDDFVERPAATAGVVGTLHAFAEDYRSATVERTREHQLLEHSVDAIDRLVDVFEDEDGVADVGGEWSSAQRRQHGEISADESTFGVSVTDLACVWRHAA